MNALAALRSRVLLAALFGLWPAFAFGQSANVSTNPPAYKNGSQALSQTPSGGLRSQLQDGAGNDVSASHPLPVNATVSASIGGFQPSVSGARMTPVSVTTSDSSGTLPTGTEAIISNVGTTNPMYCNVNGVAATTSDQLIPAESWFAFTIPSGVTTLHCIATGGSTTANGVGGAGLPTGAGGGSSAGGGGGSGAVFGPTAVGSAAANPPVLQGGTVDGTSTGNVAVQKIVSGVASDNIAQVNGVTTLTAAGATGTGSQRETVAQDTTTVAGAAPLTTGLYVTGPLAAALSTAALQTTGNTSLGTIATNTTGLATASAQATGNTSLGTIATNSATQATAANQTAIQGSKAAGTAATNSELAGCVYTSTTITLTTGQQVACQVDVNGNLKTTGGGGGGGGAVTIASGAVASGAYASGSIASGAIVSGGDVTEGVTTATHGCASPYTVNGCLGQIDDDVKGPIPAGSATIGSVGLVAGTANVGDVGLAAGAAGGCTAGHILSAASNNSTSIKASAGTLCELTIIQTTTTLGDIRLYDTASAPTCSSATGVVANYPAQSNATSPGMTINLGTYGKAFTTGIGICITGANADNDNTSAATGINVNYAYK